MPARGNSVITTIPSSSPKNKVPITVSEQTSVDKNKDINEDATNMNNCDNQHPNLAESIDGKSSKTEVKERSDSSVNSFDGSNVTQQKIYKSDMI